MESKKNAKEAFGIMSENDDKSENDEIIEINKKIKNIEDVVSLSKQLDLTKISQKEVKELKDREKTLTEIKDKVLSKAKNIVKEIEQISKAEEKNKHEKSLAENHLSDLSTKSSKVKKKIKDSFKEVDETEKLIKELQDKELKKEIEARLEEVKRKLLTKSEKFDTLEEKKKKNSTELERIKEEEKRIKEKNLSSKKSLASLKDLLAVDGSKKMFDHRSYVLSSKLVEVGFGLKNVQTLDILFMMDSTGSMTSYIEKTKAIISQLIDQTKSSFPEAEIRLAMLAYRDVSDANRFETLEFTNSVETFKSFIGKLVASGGGDAPEDINGALQKSLEFHWNSSTRILFHIGDAPCHNQFYHKFPDDYPAGYSGDKPFESLFESLLIEKILYVILNVNDTMDIMIEKFREHFLKLKKHFAAGVTPFHNRPLNNNPEHLYSSLISSVCHSMSSNIHSSLSAAFEGAHGIKPKLKGGMLPIMEDDESDCEENIPKWDSTDESYWVCQKGADLISLNIPKNDDLLKHDLEEYKATSNIMSDQQIFLHFPKANQGSFNKIFYAKMEIKYSGTKKMIAKFPKKQPDQPKAYYEKQLKLNTICKHLARIYNQTLADKLEMDKGISFVDEFVYCKDGKFGVLEMFIEGEYKKYTNNATYITTDSDETSYKMVAFSHWSYEFTEGNLMATDLQGSSSLLTDPTLHTSNRFFKNHGDFGLEGFSKFFSVHKCNQICKKLGLKVDPKFGKFSYLNKISIKKKCKNIFCIEETSKEFCDKCQGELNKEPFISKKCAEKSCKKTFQFKKKEYVFNASNDPIYCPECKAKIAFKSFRKLI